LPLHVHCPSCLANASGQFCSACGEALHPHLPSAREFAHEFIGHYVALEGKLLQTLKLLLYRPGALTLAFMRGRRLPYIAPLRLYLTLSLVMFAMIKGFGVELPRFTLDQNSLGLVYRHEVPTFTKAGRAATVTVFLNAHDEKVDGRPNDFEVRNGIGHAIAALGQVNHRWMANVQAFLAAPEEARSVRLSHGFMANLPYMLIAALPLFALYLKVLYRGARRSYGEHIVFGLHANAFAFLLASVMMAIPGNAGWVVGAATQHLMQYVSAWDYLQLLPLAWLLAYLPLALRRVYGGSWLSTAARWLVLITVHVLVIALLTVLAELIAVVGGGR
jgi:hypothetical protein